MEEKFNILIGGKKAEADKQQVIQKLAALFRCSLDQAAGLLEQPFYAVKKNITREMTEKYRIAIESTGAVCVIEPVAIEISPLDFDIVAPMKSKADEALMATGQLSRDDAIKIFIGKNHAYFLNKWEEASKKNARQSWNWVAFLLGFGWMGYRKMYLYSWIFMGIIGVETLCELAFGLPASLSGMVNIAIACIFGAKGNIWYKRHVEKQVNAILAMHDPAQARIELARQGGTNVGAAVGFVVGLLALLVLIAIVAEG